MHPCPALLDAHGTPRGPVRTNFFPEPQMTLASALAGIDYKLALRVWPDAR